jgi:hypothetical protein
LAAAKPDDSEDSNTDTDDDDEDAVPSNSASAAAPIKDVRKVVAKAREQDRSKARVKKEFSIDDI